MGVFNFFKKNRNWEGSIPLGLLSSDIIFYLTIKTQVKNVPIIISYLSLEFGGISKKLKKEYFLGDNEMESFNFYEEPISLYEIKNLKYVTMEEDCKIEKEIDFN